MRVNIIHVYSRLHNCTVAIYTDLKTLYELLEQCLLCLVETPQTGPILSETHWTYLNPES